MYKLLIADDEPLVQVGIKSMLNWNSMNIEVIGVASNGKVALEMIEAGKPDIVITDIKMPVMTGLELAKECRNKYEDTCPYFIILTSYEDFNLAREAMSAGVSDYLIKIELTPQLLESSISKVIANIEKVKAKEVYVQSENIDSNTDDILSDAMSTLASYHDKFFISLLHNLFETREQYQTQINELKLDFSYSGYSCCYGEIICGSDNLSDEEAQISFFKSSYQMLTELLVKYSPCHITSLDLRHFAVIFCFEDDDKEFDAKTEIKKIIESVNSTLKNYYNASILIGVGTYVEDELQIAESYQRARDAFNNAITDEWSIQCEPVFFDDCVKDNDFKKSFNFSIFKDDLSKSFEEMNSGLFSDTLSAIIDLFQNNPGHYLQAMDCASNILYMSISLIDNGDEVLTSLFADKDQGYRSLYRTNSMDQVIDWISEFKDRICNYFEEHKNDSRKPIVTNIKRYIKEHVADHLSQNEVAEVFAISPNYLSQLFKKYSDTGFNEYVNHCKIDEARRLLLTGEYKVYEVAEMLGFENAFYFSKVFKKVVGQPPTDFVKQIMQ